MNDETRRAHALLARTDEMLAARPRFDMDDWNARRPDPNDRDAWKAWLAELPDEPAPETDFERWKRETEQATRRKAEAREKERQERKERQRLEALVAETSRRRDAPSARLNVPAWVQPGAAKFVVKANVSSSAVLPGAPLNPVIIRKVIMTRPPGDSDG